MQARNITSNETKTTNNEERTMNNQQMQYLKTTTAKPTKGIKGFVVTAKEGGTEILSVKFQTTPTADELYNEIRNIVETSNIPDSLFEPILHQAQCCIVHTIRAPRFA